MTPDPVPGVIRTQGLSKTYRIGDIDVPAIRDVALTIAPGEFTAIVGPSGSGKTTLLNVISGLDAPSAGEVWLADTPLSSMGGRQLSDFRRDHVGFVFQAYNLIPVLTVEENIEYIMLLQNVPARERHERVMDVLAATGMTGFEDRFPSHLSGGQQQRVAVARAMVSRPALILADEPTANLDSATGAALLNVMHELNRNTGMTFVFSTHDRMVMERADRLITMKDGTIASDERKTGI